MDGQARMTGSLARHSQGRDELPTCKICGSYLDKGEGFRCPRCRRSPLCHKHRLSGSRECVGCVLEIKSKELRALKNQETGIRGFLRLVQFIFLLFATLFISSKMGLAQMVGFLRDNVIMDNLGYLGWLSVAGYVIFRAILYNQKGRISNLEAGINKIKKIELRRLV